MYLYNLYEWIAFFFIYCFIGWCFESTYVSVKSHHFVNRGFLRGPILPLYGTGAVAMLLITIPFKGLYIATYIAGFFGATILEYFTGIVMEKIFKVKYWDYSNDPLNYKGYICLKSSIVWGFFTLLLTEYIHNMISNIVTALDAYVLRDIVLVVMALFIFDFINSTRAALNLAKALEAMSKVRTELEEIQVQMALLKYGLVDNANDHFYDMKDKAMERFDKIKSASPKLLVNHPNLMHFNRLSEIKNDIEQKIAEYEKEHSSSPELISISHHLSLIKPPSIKNSKILNFFKKGLINGNPDATSKYADAMKEIKDLLSKK